MTHAYTSRWVLIAITYMDLLYRGRSSTLSNASREYQVLIDKEERPDNNRRSKSFHRDELIVDVGPTTLRVHYFYHGGIKYAPVSSHYYKSAQIRSSRSFPFRWKRPFILEMTRLKPPVPAPAPAEPIHTVSLTMTIIQSHLRVSYWGRFTTSTLKGV